VAPLQAIYQGEVSRTFASRTYN